MISLLISLLASGAIAEQASWAKDLELLAQKDSGSVEFLAIGRPSAIKIRGKGTAPEGKVTLVSDKENRIARGTLVFDMTSLDTGMDTRNEHMKEKYLETGKYLTRSASPCESQNGAG